MSVIRNKVRPPSLRAPSVPRPRLASRIAQLEEQFGVVWVRGTAGSGKTTAVLEAVESAQRDLAWLTLDSSEAAPGRLLTHLEAALTQTLPDLPPVATEALADGIAHVEAAGLLAEAVGDHELTLVVDELERLATSETARSTLSSFIRFAPPTLHVILISRRSMQLHLGSAREVGGVGHVTEADLAFSVEEAAHALEALGQAPTDAATAVQATGGWVAGVLFEAWRSPEHMHGSGGEADPLSGYLASEIMRSLSDAEQQFLIDTSVLGEVSAARAEALGLDGEILSGLRAHHLPVAFSSDGVEMRCHARFREYLQLRLRERDAAAVRELHRRHGELLASEGRHDEALPEFLAARDADAAERAAELAIGSVLRRRDFAVAERWLEALRPEAIERSEQLTYAQLVVAMQNEEWVAGAVAADRLRAMLRGSPDASLAGAIATCYLHVSRMEDAEAVVADSQPGPERDGWEFILRVAMVDTGVHFRDRPENRDAAVDGYLARLDLLQGRFDRLLDSQAAPWAGARSSRIAALRAVGRLDEALAMFDEWPSAGRSAAMVQLYAELMADLGRPLDANAALLRSRELIPRSGALSTMLHYLLEATLALRLRRDTVAATEALAKVERDPTARQRLRTLEQIELWRGLIGLLEDDAERAAVHLRYDVALLVETDRLYFLPAAAVYLAEAEWRLGDEAAADAAADRALWAAQRQGSDHLLLQALREFPAVLSRRLDAEAGTDSPWHGLGRTLMSEGLIVTAGLRPRVHVREFGTPAIVVDGREEHPKLTRSVEVLAYLAERGGRATRPELLEDLFDGRADDSARSYLRQALRGLREALPADAPLTVEGDDVIWTDEQLTSDSLKASSDIQQALHLRGRARLAALRSPLEVLERGDFLPEARSRWADRRREELHELATDARLAAAEAAFDLGDLELAEEQVQGVLANDAYRESAWRLSMRIAAALGHDDRVIARFRSCQAALADLSTTPADSTRRLLEQLRR